MNGPKIGHELAEAAFLTRLAGLRLWLAWQEEERETKDGTKHRTKVPYRASGRNGRASSTDPKTWGTLDQARARAERLPKPFGKGGVGINLADLGDGFALIGIDLDSCRDPETNTFEPWAAEVIARFNSYTEVSPSERGAKVFCKLALDDLAVLRAELGAGGKKWSRGDGKDHPPAIELYLTQRYFAVTGIRLEDVPEEPHIVSAQTVRWLIQEAGPAFAGNGHDPTTATHDNSRSAIAFRKGIALVHEGATFDEMCAALYADPETAAWSRVKGDAAGGRELRRIWDKANEQDAFCRDKNGAIIANDQNNMRDALARLGAELRHDTFANRSLLAGSHLDDAAVDAVWFRIDEHFRFRPTHELFHRFVENEARRRAFHPVRDYLDALQWDGVARIDRWLVEYAGAEDNGYTRAVGRLMLVAAVRRIREPGCKFDEMLVFISEQQGLDKSTALATLAVRPEWFTDSISLKARDKEAIEQLAGKWIVEVPELKGMRNSDIEHVKAFLSRQVDRGRLAYGRLVTEAPRQCVLFGTSNETKFLKDTSGNRRFWPIKGARFDVEKLRHDRDQLWAEAAAAEAAGEGIRLDPKLYPDAAAVQDDHREEDPWVDVLREQLGGRTGKIRSLDVWKLLSVKPGQQNQSQNTRMGQVMRELGWQPVQRRFDRVRESAYVRGTSDEQEIVLVAYYDKAMSEIQVEEFKNAEMKRIAGKGF